MNITQPNINQTPIRWCIVALILAATILFAGCNVTPPAISDAGKGVAAADAYRQAAISQAERPEAVRVILGDEHQGKALVEAGQSIEQAQAEYAALTERYTRLDARWYVRAGRSIEWIIGITVTSWVLMGVAGAALSISTGGASGIAGFIFRFLPLANPFVWLSRRGQNK